MFITGERQFVNLSNFQILRLLRRHIALDYFLRAATPAQTLATTDDPTL